MTGHLVVLNGAPRSGKTSIAREIQAVFPGIWMNLGVDAWCGGITPSRIMPGIGLRPGERLQEIEAHLPALYLALYQSAAIHCQLGLNVVMDLGHHDSYSAPLDLLPACAAVACDLPAYLVSVTCPIEVILERRRASRLEGLAYSASEPGQEVSLPVALWQIEVHRHGIYDLTLDTSELSPTQCAERILELIQTGPPPTAFEQLAEIMWDGA